MSRSIAVSLILLPLWQWIELQDSHILVTGSSSTRTNDVHSTDSLKGRGEAESRVAVRFSIHYAHHDARPLPKLVEAAFGDVATLS